MSKLLQELLTRKEVRNSQSINEFVLESTKDDLLEWS